MSWKRQDIRRIAKPLSLAAIGLLAGCVLAGAGWTLRNQAQQQFDQASGATSEAEAKAASAVADSANIAAYQSAFDQLKQRSIVGTEQRLPWVEYFTALNQAGNPSSLELKIDPRRTLEDPPSTPEPLENLQFFASKLTLNARLLHEGDAIRMLDRLRQVQGASIVRQCSLKRAEGAAAARPYLLEMACEGDIITLDTPPVAPPQ